MIRRQRTEDGGQNFVCGYAACSEKLRGKAATNPRSSVFCHLSSGFTLVEMIMVIVITGIIGGMVAMFIRAPVQGYMDSARRAEMTDIADSALRRISRDLRTALPNSVRVSPDGAFLEFIPTTGGGRYRKGPVGNILNFTAAVSPFDVLGPAVSMQAGDQIVVYNLGITGSDAYAGSSRRAYTGGAATTNTIAFNVAGGAFPFESPGNRFQVVATPVTYACVPLPGGGGTLTRYWGYAIQSSQNSTDSIGELDALVNPANASRGSALLATNVGPAAGPGGCGFTYDVGVVAQRNGLVTMQLTLTENGESVTLYNATHVSNQP